MSSRLQPMTSPGPRILKLNVRTKILVIFLALSLISLCITGFVAFFTISDVGRYAGQSSSTLGRQAVNESSVALEQAAEGSMLRIASDQAEITNVLFKDTASEMGILAAHATTLLNNSGVTPRTPSYTRNSPPANPFTGTLVELAPGSVAITGSDEYRSLAGMDDLLKAVLHADDDLVSVYVATDSGILRSYPGVSYTAPGYDPRTREWFTRAKNSGHAVWSGPYVDASGNGLIMTCSQEVPTPYGSWVIASDVTIAYINQNILNLTLAGNGYAVLLDDKGNVISRPGLTAGDIRWNEAFRSDNALTSDNPGLVAVGKNMTAGNTGIEKVLFNGSEVYIAYAPVRSLNWSFAVSLPAEQIVAPAKKTQGMIDSATGNTTAHILQQTDRIRDIFAGLFGVLLIVVIIVAVFLSRAITRPVETLKQGASALGKGDLDYRVTIRTGDEFEELAGSFNRMAADLKQNIGDLRRTTAEKERYTQELRIAKEIQENFLPETTPDIPGMDIAAVTIPAMEIGGDFYDFIPVTGNRRGFVVADVSGKGVSAALFMALSRTLIRASSQEKPDPSVALQQANRLIYEDGRSSMFVTVFYGVLDVPAMTFTYVNAGHNPPLLVRGDPPEIRTLGEGRCIALGVVPEVNVTSATLVLEPGDLIVMYTDGVTEAFNLQDEEFGEEQLVDYVTRHRHYPVQEIIDGLIDEIRRFCGSAPQSDDITVVILRVM
ncbi:MAG: SpoIIE family protein phosphatase [Methanoregula sp.]|nr:SpoIIE family protein phosphatase [Methanoregula sp.]